MVTSSRLLDAAATAQIVDPLSLTGDGSVVLLVPHPDDETLGCGLAVAALADAGVPVQSVLITDGSRSHRRSVRFPPARLAELRAREFLDAWDRLASLRHPEPLMLGYPDCETPDDPAEVRDICDRISALIGPDTGAIWASWGGDPHIDHMRTATIAAELHARHNALVRYAYPIWGRFDPRSSVPASNDLSLVMVPHLLARKQHALAAHVSQMTPLIDDDPTGFVMSSELQEHFLQHPEIFIHETPHVP